MFGDRAPATVRKHAGAFDRWSTWAKKHGLASLPANPVGVAVYLLHLGATATSPSPVLAALHGIDWTHRKACLACPGSHSVPQPVAEGLKRTLARPATKMSTLKPHHLEQLVENFGQPGCELQDLQMVALIALGFRGFFRRNDLRSLRIDDVQIGEEFLSVFLAGRKNDQWGVCIMAAHSNRWLLRGMWVAGRSVRCCSPVFGKELTVFLALALGRFFSSKGCQLDRFIFSGTSIKG